MKPEEAAPSRPGPNAALTTSIRAKPSEEIPQVPTDAPSPTIGFDETRPASPSDAETTLDGWSRNRAAAPDLRSPSYRLRREALRAQLFGEDPEIVQLGRFRVLERLGSGGMGVVYSAYDDRLDRKVAVKVLRPDTADDSSKDRLLREAQAMARLSHPNVVAVHEVDEDGDEVFVAMEFVRGCALHDWIIERRPWPEVIDVFVKAARGLQAAHDAGLVHRDFKPHNVILGDKGQVKVLDFGLALGATDPRQVMERPEAASLLEVQLTRTGALVGTPAYMSPEQFEGSEATPASDQFSFFVSLYEVLYGHLPFAASSLGELIANVSRGEVTRPASDAQVPSWIHRILLRGLAVDPSDRFPDMSAVIAALRRTRQMPRRRWLTIAGLIFVSGTMSAALAFDEPPPEICTEVNANAQAVWNDERAEKIGEAFVSAAGDLGTTTWSLVQPRLEQWATAWSSLRSGQCRALALGELSERAHDRSIACLNRQLTRVDTLMTAFLVADQASVERAVEAVAQLPPLGECADLDVLQAERAVPDARARTAVDAARREAEAARARVDLGHYDQALSQAERVAAVAREHEYEPLLALAEVIRGHALLSQRSRDAESALDAAVDAALASGDSRIAAEALARRVFVRAELSKKPALALADAELAWPLLRRSSDPPRLRWLLENNLAVAQERAGRQGDAVTTYQRALATAATLGDPSIESAYTHLNLANALLFVSDLDGARSHFTAASTAASQLLGENHPNLLAMREGEARVALWEGRPEAARVAVRLAREIAAAQPSPLPAALLPIVELEAEIAKVLREDEAPLTAEAIELAAEAHGEESWHAALTRLRLRRDTTDEHEQERDGLALLANLDPQAWGDALLWRIQARLNGGSPAAALAFIQRARTDDAWPKIATRIENTVLLYEAEALLRAGDTGQASERLAPLDAFFAPQAHRLARRDFVLVAGEVALVERRGNTAVEYLREAVSIREETHEPTHPELARARLLLAQALTQIDATTQAIVLAERSLAGYDALGPAFSAERSAVEQWLDERRNRPRG